MAILTGLWQRLSNSLPWVCLSLPSQRGGKARPQTGFHFMVQKRSVPGSSGQPLAKRPHLEIGMRLIQVARSVLVTVSPPVVPILGGKGSLEVSTPGVSQSSTSSSSSSAVFQVGMLFKFFDQWRGIICNRYVLNMVWGHHLQIRSHASLFCNF